MQRALYIDELSPVGVSRFSELQTKLTDDVVLEVAEEAVLAQRDVDPDQWNLLIADLRGLGEQQQTLIEELVETSPDTVLILVAESLNATAALALRWYGAVDCVSSQDGPESLALTVRRTLLRLKIAKDSITSMNSRVEEFDVTLELGLDSTVAESLANYTLCHLAQMDVCGLRSQLRSIRAFEEAVKRLLEFESKNGVDVDPDASDMSAPASSNSSCDQLSLLENKPPCARVRIHLSRDGFRFALRGSIGFGNDANMWFAPLLMDEVEFNESHQELTMLQLPDDVCCVVSEAVERRRTASLAEHDLLSDVLKVVQERYRHPLR